MKVTAEPVVRRESSAWWRYVPACVCVSSHVSKSSFPSHHFQSKVGHLQSYHFLRPMICASQFSLCTWKPTPVPFPPRLRMWFSQTVRKGSMPCTHRAISLISVRQIKLWWGSPVHSPRSMAGESQAPTIPPEQ